MASVVGSGGLWRPSGFHGTDELRASLAGRPLARQFFEGWYVKLVDAHQHRRLALIPGVFIGTQNSSKNSVREAFVQVLDGESGRSWYVPFDLSEFEADPRRFDVRIGPNRFSQEGMSLDLDLGDARLRGDVRFDALDPWPVRPWAPGAMGWYGYAPRLECYHGVVSFGHGLTGELQLDGQGWDFGGGRGYMEKDWGNAFPRGYVWLHSNHFGTDGLSFVGSLAVVPWLTGAFPGFLIGLRLPDRLIRFATYTGARTRHLHLDDSHVRWTVEGPQGPASHVPLLSDARRMTGGAWTLEVEAERVGGALLHAPVRPGQDSEDSTMHRRVEETLDAKLHIRLVDPRGRLVLEDTGTTGGLEVHGDVDRLLAQ